MIGEPPVVQGQSPRGIDLALPVPALLVPAPGWYRLVLLIDEMPRGFVRLEVRQTGA